MFSVMTTRWNLNKHSMDIEHNFWMLTGVMTTLRIPKWPKHHDGLCHFKGLLNRPWHHPDEAEDLKEPMDRAQYPHDSMVARLRDHIRLVV